MSHSSGDADCVLMTFCMCFWSIIFFFHFLLLLSNIMYYNGPMIHLYLMY